ncbi:hypothetical protein HK102_000185 [Quaeritorhiza haematococci]|nr:hypothetical protein HK102_000185 [Quaeritorhiza haematococci]
MADTYFIKYHKIHVSLPKETNGSEGSHAETEKTSGADAAALFVEERENVSSTLSKTAKWVVTEKIHGANCSLIVSKAKDDPDELEVSIARRTAVLKPNEGFFNIFTFKNGEFAEDLRRKAKLAFKAVEEDYMPKAKAARGPADWELEAVVIYGELFGGGYPHPQMAPNGIYRGKPVQLGIFYSPVLEFAAFDVRVFASPANLNSHHDGGTDGIDAVVSGTKALHIDGDSQAPSGTDDNTPPSPSQPTRKTWILNYDDAVSIFQKASYHYCEALQIGTWTEVNDHPLEFETTWPRKFGLPPFPEDCRAKYPQRAEGIVIKPVKTVYNAKGERIIVKRLASSFVETVKYGPKGRVPKNKKDRKGGDAGKKKEDFLLDGDFQVVEAEMLSMVTPKRIESVVSKHGRVPPSPEPTEVPPPPNTQTTPTSTVTLDQLMKAFVEDVMEEVSTVSCVQEWNKLIVPADESYRQLFSNTSPEALKQIGLVPENKILWTFVFDGLRILAAHRKLELGYGPHERKGYRVPCDKVLNIARFLLYTTFGIEDFPESELENFDDNWTEVSDDNWTDISDPPELNTSQPNDDSIAETQPPDGQETQISRPYFPPIPEIVRNVLAYVDESDMIACCLVNQIWAAEARPTIWRRPIFEDPDQLYRFLFCFESNRKHVAEQQSLLLSGVNGFIRELRVAFKLGSSWFRERAVSFHSLMKMTINVGVLDQALDLRWPFERLPHLHIVFCETDGWPEEDAEKKQQARNFFSQFTHISWFNDRGSDAIGLDALVKCSTHKSLKYFHLPTEFSTLAEDCDLFNQCSSRSLRAVGLMRCPYPIIYTRWLCKDPFRRLTALSIQDVEVLSDPYSNLECLMQMCGPRLQFLDLSHGDKNLQLLDIIAKHCKSLKYLCLSSQRMPLKYYVDILPHVGKKLVYLRIGCFRLRYAMENTDDFSPFLEAVALNCPALEYLALPASWRNTWLFLRVGTSRFVTHVHANALEEIGLVPENQVLWMFVFDVVGMLPPYLRNREEDSEESEEREIMEIAQLLLSATFGIEASSERVDEHIGDLLVMTRQGGSDRSEMEGGEIAAQPTTYVAGTAPQRALLLPEILRHVFIRLDESDLTSCYLVNRSWAAETNRLIWREPLPDCPNVLYRFIYCYELNRKYATEQRTPLWEDAARLIQHLHITFDFGASWFLQRKSSLRNLKELTISVRALTSC